MGIYYPKINNKIRTKNLRIFFNYLLEQLFGTFALDQSEINIFGEGVMIKIFSIRFQISLVKVLCHFG